ncbi:MAG: hypothetical protein ABIQ32_05870 [Sphingomicrobium sp.]
MKSLDLWLVGFGLRCGALLLAEIACFLFVVPTLFNLHSDLANAGAAVLAIVGLTGGYLGGAVLTRELRTLIEDHNNE